MNQPVIDIVSGLDYPLIEPLVAMQQLAFPPTMQPRDPAAYFREALADPGNINVLLRAGSGELIGYLLALPHLSVCAELQPWDPDLTEDPTAIYIDIVQTLPGRRQAGGFVALLEGVCGESRKRGYARVAMHVRTSTGLSALTQKLFCDCRARRRIENWYGSEEAFDYLEAAPRLRSKPL